MHQLNLGNTEKPIVSSEKINATLVIWLARIIPKDADFTNSTTP
jgi:hypothetical protein